MPMFRREITAYLAASAAGLRIMAEGGAWTLLAGLLVIMLFMPRVSRADDEVTEDLGVPAAAAPAPRPAKPPAKPSQTVPPSPNAPYAPAPYVAPDSSPSAPQPVRPGYAPVPYPAGPYQFAPYAQPNPVVPPHAPPAAPPALGALSAEVEELLSDEEESIDALTEMATELLQKEDVAAARCAVVLMIQATARTRRMCELRRQLEREETQRHLGVMHAPQQSSVSVVPRQVQSSGSQIVLKLKIADVAQKDWAQVAQVLVPADLARIGQWPEPTLLPGRLEGLEALERKKLLRVTAEPTVVTLAGRPAHVQLGDAGSVLTIDAVPELTSSGTIRTEIRIREMKRDASDSQVFEVDTGLETKPGQTAVFCDGPLGDDAESQRLILLTAEVVDATSPVSPARRR
jgi:hypothetical protein